MPRMRKDISFIFKQVDHKIRTKSKFPSGTNKNSEPTQLSSVNISYLVLEEVLALHKV